MDVEKQKILIEKYPSLFKGVNRSPIESCMCFDIECCDGWYDIIDDVCKKIMESNEVNNIEFTSIKENLLVLG